MTVKYELERVPKFEELCEIVLRFKKDGLFVYDNVVTTNDGDVYIDCVFVSMQNSCEDVIFNIENNKISLTGFTPQEALEKYNIILDCMEE